MINTIGQNSNELTLKSINTKFKYVLVTPARNEEAFIEETLKSVISQKTLPIKWVIVSDGSTDATNEIVKKYADQYDWIEPIFLPVRKERHFAGKVYAFNAGYERLKDINYDFIGSLDADISFDREYFDYLISKFNSDKYLGVVGTPFREGNSQYDYRFSRKEHVSGACQLFRRECFEAIGGYIPIKAGAIDLTAVVMARMKGWRTETFTEKHSTHHRRMGSAKANLLAAHFRSGYLDYPMGVHPLWQILRSVYQMSRKPIFVGGFMLFLGYFWAVLKREPTPVSREFVQFRRKEQIQWLKEYPHKFFQRLKKSYNPSV